MRVTSLVGLLLAGLLLVGTGGQPSHAQYGYYAPAPPPPSGRRYQERVAPGYEARPRYVPSPRYQPAPPPASGFFFPWMRPAEPVYQPEPSYRPARRRERPEPREVRRRPPRVTPAPTREAEKPQEPEVEPSTFVAVVGDSFADSVGKGLDEAFEENLDVEIVNKARGDSGLVRIDHHDWPKTVQEVLATPQKVTYAVAMLGANDRQAIREGEVSHDPLSDRWRDIYRERVDAILRPFVERRIPLIWVGLPPMKNERVSTDAIALNEIYRDRVQKAGGIYVDIWEAFSNDENRYSPVGPDVDGQVVRLRATDGVHFTKAGARKAAHFVDIELKRLIEARAPGAAVAVAPTVPGAAGSGIDRLVNTSLPAVPDPQNLPGLAPRPVAGPVLPLNRVDVSPGGALASTPPRPNPDTAFVVERALRDGVLPPPARGRADDFSWPKPNATP